MSERDAIAMIGVRDAQIERLTRGCEALRTWGAELHRQLEKIWYTPAGVAYSDEEAQRVVEVLGPTDEAVPKDFDRAAFWYERHGRAALAATAEGASEQAGSTDMKEVRP